MRQSDDHTRARGFVAESEDGKGRLSFNVNGRQPQGTSDLCIKLEETFHFLLQVEGVCNQSVIEFLN